MSLTDITIFYSLCALLSTNYCVCGDFPSKGKSDYGSEERSLKENEKREYAHGDGTYENSPSAVIQEYKKFQSELGRNLFAKIGANADNQRANDLLMPETKIRYDTVEPKSSEAIDVDKIIEDLDNAKAAAEKSMPYILEKPSLEVNKKQKRSATLWWLLSGYECSWAVVTTYSLVICVMLKERWIPFHSHKGSKNKSSKSKTESQPKTPCIDCRQKTGNEVILNEQTKTEPDYNIKPKSKSESQDPFNYFKINKRSDYPCQCPSCRSKLVTAPNTDLSYFMKESDPSKFLISSTQKTKINFDLDYIPNVLSVDSKNLRARKVDINNELEQKRPNLLKEIPYGNLYRADYRRRFAKGKGKMKRYASVSINEVDSANERRLKMLDEIQKKIDNVQIPQASNDMSTTEINIA
ncbi:hypothetical protein EVAR_15902_1 [Eumeta japonica]|uniref:Uncharacterized protein n=1 Tax=Eumeta variegata TaxID=151549 RepID=A0A4C1UFG5_EUMVA|nr:hypothetical protein EVAR_15902_1 [Eumeta japonica]